MIFLDPKIDWVFKRLFGTDSHKNILMSFLNSVLEKKGGEEIVDVVINDPNNIPETVGSKHCIVDVRCTDQLGNQYIIEMQVIREKDYTARAQFYSALALSRQLAAGEPYAKLVPVIFVGVLDFTVFKNKNYLSHHFILDSETYTREFNHFEFHFIELGKFNKQLEELETIADKWAYFFKHAMTLDNVPTPLSEPGLTEAFGVLEQGKWSKKELEAYDRYLDAARSRISQLETAFEDGAEQGFEKGVEQGIEQGIAQGIEQGALEKQITIAKKLLDMHDIPTIAHITGLTVEEIENLKKMNN